MTLIVDRLTKVSHFIPVKTTYRSDQLAQLYVNKIVTRPTDRAIIRRVRDDMGRSPVSSQSGRSMVTQAAAKGAKGRTASGVAEICHRRAGTALP